MLPGNPGRVGVGALLWTGMSALRFNCGSVALWEPPRFLRRQHAHHPGLPLILTEPLSLKAIGRQASEIRPRAKHPTVDLTNQTQFRSD